MTAPMLHAPALHEPMSPAPVRPLGAELRDAIDPAHRAVEETALARSIVAETIERPAYLALLGQLVYLHEGLEAELDRHRSLAGAWRPDEMARTRVLAGDRVALGASAVGAAPLAGVVAYRDYVQALSARVPEALLGALYVLEGSRMGSCVVAPCLARALSVPLGPGQGLDYHLQGFESAGKRLREFKRALDERVRHPGDRAWAVHAALRTMDVQTAIFGALAPSGGEVLA